MVRRIAVLLAALLTPSIAAAQLRIVMIDVGQADSIAVITPSGCAALFDGGKTGSGATVKATLRSYGVTHLYWAVASHLHEDHLGGLDEVNQGTDAIAIDKVYDRGGTYSSTAFTQYTSQFSGKRNTVTVGQVIPLCELSFKVLAVNANGLSTTDENALSIVMKVSFGAFDAIFGGDCQYSPTNVEGAIASAVGDIELYKVHHHGSKTSSGTTLMNAAKPQVALISVGYDNTYGHPTAEAISRMTAVGATIYQTEDPATSTKRGNIVVSTATGATYTVTQGSSTRTFTSKGGGGGDTTPPSVPANLSATAVSSSQINLAWSASTDNVGVTGYRIYRSTNGSTFSSIATTSSTSYSNTGLTASTTYYYRVTAYDAAGNESGQSSTASATTSGGTAQQLLLNPGFESGAVNWVASSGVITNSTTYPPHSGSWYAWLDGYGTTHTDTLYQQVTIPSTVTSATFSFWLRVVSAETTTTTAYDKLTVTIRNSSNTVLKTLATYSNLNKGSVYVQKSFDVTAYKGQTIRVYFTGTEDSSVATSFLIDDTALNVQ